MAYVTQSMYPSGTPTASIFMDGLLALCFKGKDKCARTQLGSCVARIGHPFSDRTPCMACIMGHTEEFVP